MKTYSYQNGVLVSNEPNTQAKKLPPLANVSTFDDLKKANAAIAKEGGTQRINSVKNLGTLKGPEYEEGFELSEELVDVFGNEGAIDELMEIFEKNQIPLGLLDKLKSLGNYDVNFIIDDSGSTTLSSDALLKEAHPCMTENMTVNPRERMTRFQEIESRVHYLIDFLAYFPSITLSFTFLNSSGNTVNELKAGKSFGVTNSEKKAPKDFAAQLHQEIINRFKFKQKFATPIKRELTASLELAEEIDKPTHHYLLTDGLPSDAGVEDIINIVRNRKSPANNPITLCSCSNEDKEVAWLKSVEEAAYYCSESDDYQDERREVRKDQGPAFPFTKGFWLMMQAAAALNPNDLDQMDENLPFTKNIFEKLLGRTLSNTEYRYYFDLNPHAKLYRDLYADFSDGAQHKTAKEIVSQHTRQTREKIAGYQDGSLPGNDSEANLYAYIPLSRDTFTKLFHPDIANAQAMAPIVESSGCCGFFSEPPPLPVQPCRFVAIEVYKNYFDSLPAIQIMSDSCKASLFDALSQERHVHAHKLIDFNALQAQIDGRTNDVSSVVSNNSHLQVEHIQPQIAGGFSVPATSGAF